MLQVARQKTEGRKQKSEDRSRKSDVRFFCLLSSVLCFLSSVSVMLVSAGCAPKVQRPMRVCPGAESAAASLSVQKQHFENAVAFRANGQCLLSYYDEQNKCRSENFPVKLWAAPPAQLYLQGDVAFDPKGIVLGSNQREFWLSMKPKEISSYIWGRWSQQSCFEELAINPELLLEALGILQLDTGGNWSLSNSGAFDVLTKYQAAGITKKVYIYSCDHLTRRIEYCDTNGKVLVVTELDGYKLLVVRASTELSRTSSSKPVSQDFWVPSVINIVRHRQDGRSDSVSITLRSIKPMQLTEKRRSQLFDRSEPVGFEHIYELDENCSMIEQPQ
jgi:hypothetical protein